MDLQYVNTVFMQVKATALQLERWSLNHASPNWLNWFLWLSKLLGSHDVVIQSKLKDAQMLYYHA